MKLEIVVHEEYGRTEDRDTIQPEVQHGAFANDIHRIFEVVIKQGQLVVVVVVDEGQDAQQGGGIYGHRSMGTNGKRQCVPVVRDKMFPPLTDVLSVFDKTHGHNIYTEKQCIHHEARVHEIDHSFPGLELLFCLARLGYVLPHGLYEVSRGV